MKKLIYLMLALWAVTVILAVPGDALAQINWVELHVNGEAPIENNDLASARENAIQDALEKAMTQASAKILTNQETDVSFQALKSVFLRSADRYVQNFRIMAESRQQDVYIVMVSAVIALSALRQDFIDAGILHREETHSKTVMLYYRGLSGYVDYARMISFLQNRPIVIQSFYPCRLQWHEMTCELTTAGSIEVLIGELARTGRYAIEISQEMNTVTEIFVRRISEEP